MKSDNYFAELIITPYVSKPPTTPLADGSVNTNRDGWYDFANRDNWTDRQIEKVKVFGEVYCNESGTMIDAVRLIYGALLEKYGASRLLSLSQFSDNRNQWRVNGSSTAEEVGRSGLYFNRHSSNNEKKNDIAKVLYSLNIDLMDVSVFLSRK